MFADSFSILEIFVRVFAGILFIFQGYDKLFRVRIKGVVTVFQGEAGIYQIPSWLLTLLAFYTSVVEFFGGILLIVGFFTKFILVAFCADLILVALAFSIVEPMWDTKHVFPRVILIALLLALQANHSAYSLDALFTTYFLK